MSQEINKSGGVANSTKVMVVVMFMAYAGAAFAGSSDPLGNGICKVVELLTGKWAFGLSVMALVGVAAAFLFGVEMNEVMKKIAVFITAVAFLIGGASVLTYVFPSMTGC